MQQQHKTYAFSGLAKCRNPSYLGLIKYALHPRSTRIGNKKNGYD